MALYNAPAPGQYWCPCDPHPLSQWDDRNRPMLASATATSHTLKDTLTAFPSDISILAHFPTQPAAKRGK